MEPHHCEGHLTTYEENQQQKKELIMTLHVIAVKNARVSGDLKHINARVLHQAFMILKPY